MRSNKSKETFGVNIGTSSLLLVFVVMCLVSFATLSTVSANADKKLNEKLLDKSDSYYAACNEAEERLMNIDKTLKNIYETGVTRDEYLEQAGEAIDFAIPVTDTQTLDISIKVNYPSVNDKTFYNITKWQLVNTGTLEEEHVGLNLLF